MRRGCDGEALKVWELNGEAQFPKARRRDCQMAAFRWVSAEGLVGVNGRDCCLERKAHLRITEVDHRLCGIGDLHQTAGGAHGEADLLL